MVEVVLLSRTYDQGKALQSLVSSSTRELAETFRDHEDDALEEASGSLRMKLRADQMEDSVMEEAVKALEEVMKNHPGHTEMLFRPLTALAQQSN